MQWELAQITFKTQDMKDLKLKENEVVHCKTENQANKVLKIAHKLGAIWAAGNSLLEKHYWYMNKERTCYNLNKGLVASKEYYETERYSVITAKEFLKRHKEDDRKQSGWYKDDSGISQYLAYLDFENGLKFGFNSKGKWMYSDTPEAVQNICKAVKEEVENCLIEEANRRYPHIYNYFKGLNDDKVYGIINHSYKFSDDLKVLTNYGNVVMLNGKWAESIEIEPSLRERVEKLEAKVCVLEKREDCVEEVPIKEHVCMAHTIDLDREKSYYLGDLNESQFLKVHEVLVKEGCTKIIKDLEHFKRLLFRNYKEKIVGFHTDMWYVSPKEGEYVNALSLFVVKAWDNEDEKYSKYIYGVFEDCDEDDSTYPYTVGGTGYSNIEEAPPGIAQYFNN